MTAPAIAPAPTTTQPLVAPAAVVETQAPVVETPVVPSAEPQKEGWQNVIDRITRKPIPEDAVAPAVETTAGELTSELTPALTPADGALVLPEPTPAQFVSEIMADEPDGQVVLRARDPVTGQFSDMDQSRTYELSIKDPRTGEKRVYEKTLPELMRMAKDGVSHMKSRDELAFYRDNVPKWQEGHQGLQTQLATARTETESLRSLAIELLTADAQIVDQRRLAYAEQFTPERENERLKAELAAARSGPPAPTPANQPSNQHNQQAIVEAQTIQSFGTRVAPIVQEVEGLVGREAAAGHMALVTLPLLVNGRVPTAELPRLEQYMQGPYREWAKAEAAKKGSAAKELEAARQIQARAQQAARQAGTATRPAGGTPSNAPVAPPKAKNLNEAMDRVIRGRPVAAI